MPIINQVVKGGGTTPTGTKSITANGVYDVTDFASADVQVPTTAPAYYIEKAINANGKLIGAGVLMNLSGINSIGAYALNCAYRGVSFPTSTVVNFSSLTTINENEACLDAFRGTNITAVNMPQLTTIDGEMSCKQMFYDCKSLTTVSLPSLTSIINSVKSNMCISMFSGCDNLTDINLSSLQTLKANQACQTMFINAKNLVSVSLPSLIEVSSQKACDRMFEGCIRLTTADLSSLTIAKAWSPLSSMFNGCKLLTNVNLSSLAVIQGSYTLSSMFSGCVALTTISFPSINPQTFNTDKSHFNSMFYNCAALTEIHFPSNVQAQISALNNYNDKWGAANATILFDLPATNTLTGADTQTYTRNPKYDTGTALAWKVGAYGTTNLTPAYYTSGLTDPSVSDAIYSDAACTQSVTTITAIS